MEELSKSIKLHAGLIIAGCATVAAFLLSPGNPLLHVAKAKEELEGLRKLIDVGVQYKDHARSRLNEQRFKLLQDAIDTKVKFSDVVKNAPPSETTGGGCSGCTASAASPVTAGGAVAAPAPPAEAPKPFGGQVAVEAALAPASDPKKQIEIFEQATDGAWRPNKSPLPQDEDAYADVPKLLFECWGSSLPFTTDAPPHIISLNDAYHFVARESSAVPFSEEIQIFTPHSIDFAEKFRCLLSRYPGGRLTEWKISTTSSPKPLQSTAAPEVQTCPSLGRLICTFDVDGKKKSLCTTVKGEWKCGSCNSLHVTSFLQWIEKEQPEVLNKLKEVEIDKNGAVTSQKWLPKSRKVWSDISAKEVDEAIVALDMKIQKDTERISLFGLSASSASASIAFPIAISIVLLINTLQLSHLVTCLEEKSDSSNHTKTQWFGFGPGLPVFLMTAALVCVFPIAVFIWLCISASAYDGKMLWCLTLGLCLIAACLLHLKMYCEVRKRCYPQSAPDAMAEKPTNGNCLQSLVEKHVD